MASRRVIDAGAGIRGLQGERGPQGPQGEVTKVALDAAINAAQMAQAAAESARDQAKDISHIDTSDDVVAALVRGTAGAGQKTRSGLATYNGSLSVTDGTMAAIRDGLTAAAALGLGEVLVTAPTTHDGGTDLTVPTNTRLRFAPGATVTVPPDVTSGVVILSTGSEVSGLRVAGNGANKSTDKFAVTAPAGATDLTVRDVYTDQWHGTGIRLIDCSNVRVLGGTHTNVTRSGDAGLGGVHISARNADCVNVLIDGVTVIKTGGGGIQMDGDWNRPDWKTNGVKIRGARIVNCYTENMPFAGVFINSGYDCVIEACIAKLCGDIGIDYEFCISSTISSCTARLCGNFGIAVYQNGEHIAVTGCTVEECGTGYVVHHGQVVADQIGTRDVTFTGCTSRNNKGHGFGTQELVSAVSIVGCTSRGNAGEGVVSAGTDIHVVGCLIEENGANGVNLGGADYSSVEGGTVRGNSSHGISLLTDGANPTNQILITGATVRDNAKSAILGTADIYRVRVINCEISGHTNSDNPAVLLSAGDGHLIQSCIMRGNRRNIVTVYGRRLSILDNTIYLVASGDGIQLASSGPSSAGGRVARNTLYGANAGERGLLVDGGTSDGASLYIEDNEFVQVSAWYVSGTIGASFPILWRGRVPVTPNGNVDAAVGSLVTWTGGANGTTLWTKETGTNTKTGWVGK